MRNTKENKNSFSYAFRQQILRAWQPVPTLQSTIIIFIVLGLIFLGFGIALIVLSNQIIEYKQQYDATCMSGDTMISPCDVYFTVTETMAPPVFLYYELDNFYQNHRRYLKSRDNDQLAGTVKTVADLDDCDPVIRNRDIKTPLYSYFVAGLELPADGPANPCGLVAKSFFTDSYTLYPVEGTSTSAIFISETGIAWEADVKNKFKRPTDYQNLQWTDVENEHFIVWMRTAATPNFRKLWGRITQPLTPGRYRIEVSNTYDVSSFGGAKSIVLSTANVFGGKNYFLAIAYLVVGGISLVVALLFFIKDKISPPRNLPKFD